MKTTNKRIALALALVTVVLLLVAGIRTTKRGENKAPSWSAAGEGFLAIATPCCSSASLWDSLEEVTDDGQRARAATVAEAVRWLDTWPYRSRDDRDVPVEQQFRPAAQSSEVRCKGASTGGAIPQRGNDEETLQAVRKRRECVYTKWRAWTSDTPAERLNERHTVWADENGFLHGRVDYWH